MGVGGSSGIAAELLVVIPLFGNLLIPFLPYLFLEAVTWLALKPRGSVTENSFSICDVDLAYAFSILLSLLFLDIQLSSISSFVCRGWGLMLEVVLLAATYLFWVAHVGNTLFTKVTVARDLATCE